MKRELDSAAQFLIRHMKKAKSGITNLQLKRFYKLFIASFYTRYKSIWIPHLPNKCSSFRCIRICDTYIDPTLQYVCETVKILLTIWSQVFPCGILLKIDPNSVTFFYNDVCYIIYNNPTD